jgi:hypothetical protein
MDGGLFEMLEAYAARGIRAMHMPGHKRRADAARYLAALGAGLDITEIDGFDNLHRPSGVLRTRWRGGALWGSRGRIFSGGRGRTVASGRRPRA